MGATLWLAASCGSNDPGPAPRPATGADDYAVARTKFHTKLTRQKPSPQSFDPLKLPADVREVTFASGELQLSAWVSQVADGAPPQPAVLFLHGGFAFDLGDWQMARPFRDAGFVVMVPRLRGENGQAGYFSAFYDEVDDVLAAAEALAHQPGVDPGRLYISGHSVGGTLTMLAAMASPRFRAAASLSGAPSQLAWIAGQREIAPYNTADHDEIRMRSPILFATSFKCPTRLYWGDHEPFFTNATRQTASLAKAAGLDVEAVQVPGSHMSMVTPAVNLAIEFFQKHR